MIKALRQWLSSKDNERGQGLVEYALILVLVAVVVIVILALFGETIQARYHFVYSQIRCAMDTSMIVDMYEDGGGETGRTPTELAFMRVNDTCIAVLSVEYDQTYDTLIRDSVMNTAE
ncbi:MAG: hypothetical protein AAF787_01710 [Chloroflexota bacterium]